MLHVIYDYKIYENFHKWIHLALGEVSSGISSKTVITREPTSSGYERGSKIGVDMNALMKYVANLTISLF